MIFNSIKSPLFSMHFIRDKSSIISGAKKTCSSQLDFITTRQEPIWLGENRLSDIIFQKGQDFIIFDNSFLILFKSSVYIKNLKQGILYVTNLLMLLKHYLILFNITKYFFFSYLKCCLFQLNIIVLSSLINRKNNKLKKGGQNLGKTINYIFKVGTKYNYFQIF